MSVVPNMGISSLLSERVPCLITHTYIHYTLIQIHSLQKYSKSEEYTSIKNITFLHEFLPFFTFKNGRSA